MGHALPSRHCEPRPRGDASCSTPTAEDFAPIAWWWPAAGCRFQDRRLAAGLPASRAICDPRLGTAPALVPLTLPPETLAASPSGLPSTPSRAAAADVSEKALVTHRGLSGPRFCRFRVTGSIRPTPRAPRTGAPRSAFARQRRAGSAGSASHQPQPATQHPERMATKRFAQAWCELHDCSGPLNRMSARPSPISPPCSMAGRFIPPVPRVTQSGGHARRGRYPALSSRPWKRVSCRDSSSSARSSTSPATSAAGNFQWAWSSGHAAGCFA